MKALHKNSSLSIAQLLLVFAGLVWPAAFLRAQPHWRRADSAFGPLPAAVQVFSSQDSLDGAPCRAFYVSVRLKEKSVQCQVQTGEGARFTPEQFYLQQASPPLLVVNGPYFSFQSGKILSLVIRNGKIVNFPVAKLPGSGEDSGWYYYPTRAAIGIGRNRKADIAWIFADPQHARPYAFEDGPAIAKGKEEIPSIFDLADIHWKWWEMRTAMGGGPMLVHNGKIRITSREEQMFPEGEFERGPRTAMGYTADNRLIILVIEGRNPGYSAGATLLQLAGIMKNLGCYEALNLDGGGSSCMLLNGRETIRPSDTGGQRPLPAVFMISRTDLK